MFYYTRLKKNDGSSWAVGGLDGRALNFAIRAHDTREERKAFIDDAFANGFAAQAISMNDAQNFLCVVFENHEGAGQEELDEMNCNAEWTLLDMRPDWNWLSATPWAV